jgi:branched-chain amino acid transport system substrate-binding protein
MNTKTEARFLLFCAGLCITACALFLSGCNFGKENLIKVGMLATLSDYDPPTGLEMKRAAETAMRKIEAEEFKNRKIGKVKVELIIEDDYGTPETSVEAARKLIYRNEVDAVVGPQFSSNAIPVAALAEKAGVLMLAPMSTNPKTTAGKEFVFRIPFTDLMQAEAMAGFAYEDLGFSNISVLYNISDEYSRGLANQFKTIFSQIGGTVSAFVHYTYDTNKDFTNQLSRVKEQTPEALYLPNYHGDVMLQVPQVREMGISAVMLGGDGWSDAAAAEAEGFEGSFLTRHWHPDIANAEARKVMETYRKEYGKNPDDVFMNTYDAFSLLFRSIREAGELTPDGLRDSIAGMDQFDGVSGTFYYEQGGDPRKQVHIIKLDSGKARLYKTLDPGRG